MYSSYQETAKSCYVSKDSLFSDAVAYSKVQGNTVEKRHFFKIVVFCERDIKLQECEINICLLVLSLIT